MNERVGRGRGHEVCDEGGRYMPSNIVITLGMNGGESREHRKSNGNPKAGQLLPDLRLRLDLLNLRGFQPLALLCFLLQLVNGFELDTRRQ